MLVRVVERGAGWQWRCTCGERGPRCVDWETARAGHVIHSAHHQERVQ